jgi:GNAT superfamily N-acetyltransferase
LAERSAVNRQVSGSSPDGGAFRRKAAGQALRLRRSGEGLRPYQEAGRAWVAVDDDDQPVGYLITEVVDGQGHIEQVSVHPRHAGQRIGRSLIDQVANRAAAQGLSALTLTTFADVAWNAPYCRRCGFRTLSEDELTPGLRHIRSGEARRGWDKWPRVAMIRAL